MNLSMNLRRAAARRPENAAFIGLGPKSARTATYAELDRLTDSAARWLLARGVEPGMTAALAMESSIEFVIGQYALHRIGAVVVPVNPRYVAPEVDYILGDCGAGFILAAGDYASKAETLTGVGFLNMDQWEPDSGPPVADAGVADSQTAVIQYTQAVDGDPMGAMLSHGNLVFDALASSVSSRLTQEDRFFCVLPLYHGFCAMANMHVPILLGASVIIPEEFSPLPALKAVKDYSATVFTLVPTILAYLCLIPDLEKIEFPSIRLVVPGGAPLWPELHRKADALFPGRVLQGYGVSECGPVTAVNPVDGENRPDSVGLSLPGIEIEIMDHGNRILAPGLSGEIVVRGPNVFKGYHNRPEETSAALVDGWFHTGDLGHKDNEGYIYITGRKKRMILVGGFNVYPAQVERELLRVPGVKEAAVLSVPDPMLGEQVAAVVVLEKGRELTAKALRDQAASTLARYKLPRRVVFVERIPRDESGAVTLEGLM